MASCVGRNFVLFSPFRLPFTGGKAQWHTGAWPLVIRLAPWRQLQDLQPQQRHKTPTRVSAGVGGNVTASKDRRTVAQSDIVAFIFHF